MKNFFNSIGELRSFMLFVTLSSIGLTFFTDTRIRMEGWGLLPDVLAPVVSFILLFILLLDMLMSRVFMVEADDTKRQKFSNIFWLELFQVIALITFWTPYLVSVLS